MRTKSIELMKKIESYIDDFFIKNNRVPTVRETAKALQTSKSRVSSYLCEMKKMGMIDKQDKKYGVVTKAMSRINYDTISIPVVGTIACGTPILAEENIEDYLAMPKELLGKGEFFILRASGNSMINAGVEDGDYVIIRKEESAQEGQIIVALVDNEVTLKRYYIDKDKQMIRLHPENNEMEDMYFENIVIQGVAVRVIKELK